MVKFFELMGLATFNVMIALTLSTTVLNNRAESGVSALSSENITTFINDIGTVSAGLRPEMDQHTMVQFLMDHLTENGRYKTDISYSIGDAGAEERSMDMGRMEFISYVLQGLKAMDKHETKTNIEYIKIEEGNRAAHVVITNYERGMMPMDDGFGDIAKVPVLGTSYCEQRVVLNDKKMIQLDGANCTTTISFEEAF